MANPKLVQPLSLLQALRPPYRHQLNYEETDCARDCPACRWLERTSDMPADDSRYVVAALRIYWEQDGVVVEFADLPTDVQSTILRTAAELKQLRK